MEAAVWTLIALYAAFGLFVFRGLQELRKGVSGVREELSGVREHFTKELSAVREHFVEELSALREEFGKRLGDVSERLSVIEARLNRFEDRIVALEEHRR